MNMVQRTLLRLLCIVALSCFGHEAFAQAPVITSIDPASGPEKRNVTINGANFLGGAVTTRTLRLNGTSVTIQSTTATRLIFTVPVGATSGPITLQTNLGTVTAPVNFTVAPGSAPGNDSFSSAEPLSGDTGAVTGNTANATKEPGEPNHANVTGGASVWYRWTAPSSGPFLFNPHDLTGTNFGVNLAIYTGTSVNALTPVTSGASGISTSRYLSAAAFNAEAGTTYYIAIDGFNGIMGDYRLTWSPLPPTSISAFAPATVYAGQAFNIQGQGMVPGMQVTVGGVTIPASRVTYGAPTFITVAQLPIGVPVGPAAVSLVGPLGGTLSTVLLNVQAAPAPIVASFTPTTGSGNVTVTIGGTALWLGDGTGTIVRFNGQLSPSVTLTNSTTISARLPSGATTGPISVTTPAGTGVSGTLFTVPGSAALPLISSFTPQVGLPGTPVSISGQNFSGASNVSFGNVSATFTVDAQGQTITTTVPAGATTGNITVSTPGGTAVSFGAFFVGGPPTISHFSPTAITNGNPVVITGTNFAGLLSVSFNGVPSTNFSVESATEIVAVVPPGPLVDGPITVNTVAGQVVSADSFTYYTTPSVATFSPTTITQGTVVTITGSSFTNVTSVSFNGAEAASFTVDSATQITAVAPVAPVFDGPITVTNSAGSGSSSLNFTYTTPAPVITSFSPTTIAAGVSVTINVTNLSSVFSVNFNGVSAPFVFAGPGQLIATAPTPLTAGPITVVTGNGTATSPFNYTVTTKPVITAITPGSGPQKRIMTVFGSNFNDPIGGTTIVRFNGLSVGSLSRSNTQITFAVPVGAVTGPVTVQTSQGVGVSPSSFVVTAGAPPANDNFANAQVIDGVIGIVSGDLANATKEPGEPNHADNAGGASVWMKWVAPQSGLFLFNPQPPGTPQSATFGLIMSIYTGDTLGTLTRVASSQPPANVLVRYGSAAVLNAVAGTTYFIAIDGFSGVMPDYRLAWAPLDPPVISFFSPGSATAGQTLTVNILGQNFPPGSTVSFGGGLVDSTRISYQSPTQITISQVPITALTGPIIVTTPAGVAVSSSFFNITPPPAPVIASLEYTGAKVGTAFAITGSNFTGASAVKFNGTPASFTVVSATQITTTVPAGATSGFITVTTPGGTATSTVEFTVIAPPVITAQPVPQSVTVGQTATFTVTATSNGPLEYSWHKEGGSLVGNPTAYTSTLTLPSVTADDAGVYYCQVGNNAAILETIRVTLTVGRATAIVIIHNNSTTYDGTPKTPTVTTIPAGLPVQIIYPHLLSDPVDAGSYLVGAVVFTPSYEGGAATIFTINPAPAEISLTNLSATYDGAPHAATATTTPAGLAVNLTYNGSSTVPSNAGSYSVEATITNRNYTGSATGGLFIAPAAVSFSPSNLSQVYDGSPKTIAVTTSPAGIPVRVTYNGNTTAPTNAGTWPFEINTANPNYTGATAGTFTITKAPATIALSNLSATYDGAPHAPTVTTTPAGLAYTLAYTGSSGSPVGAGNYPVVGTIIDANYTGTASGTFSIAKGTATVTLAGLNQTYDGTAKPVTATTSPAGLPVVLLYNGSVTVPVNAGVYAVEAHVPDLNYSGTASGTLIIAKGAATITLSDLNQPYTGQPHTVAVETTPAGLPVTVTYNGSATAPTSPGTYAVAATVDSANQGGTASGTLVVTIPALVRHAPVLNGGLDGSVQVLSGEDITLNGSAYVSGDILAPGLPTVLLNGHPTFVGTRDGTGATTPTGYRVTLNGSALLRYLVRRTDPLALPTITAPPAPTGTRSVSINIAGQSAGDFATLRNLTLNSNVGTVAVPPGNYGNLTANSGTTLLLGVAGGTTPAVYNLQNLTINSTAQLQLAGPVVITLANGTSFNGNAGDATHPEWLTLNVASGGVTLNGNVTVHGHVVAPNGTVTLNATLHGSVVADRLTINGNGLLDKID